MLRTTALLPALKEKLPRSHVTWVAVPAAADVFAGNKDVDRFLPFSPGSLQVLRQERFDLLWSLDVDPAVAAWAPDLKAAETRGFSYSAGVLKPSGPAARGWLDLSLRDDLKRANSRTYQDWMFEICGLPWEERFRPRWTVSAEEALWAQARRKAWKVPAGARLIGLNTGAGARWRQKKWTEEGLSGFLSAMRREKSRVLLLGGPEERERNRRLKRRFPWAVDAGCDNTLRRFAALVGLCGLVVTGDTLAMHLAVALGKRVVALFGPTSSSEIELYGRGEKVFKDWDCLPCYRAECARAPNCMEALTAGEVVAAARRQLAAQAPA